MEDIETGRLSWIIPGRRNAITGVHTKESGRQEGEKGRGNMKMGAESSV